jgi:SpoVK/Ycf46/Vps4 family AAA+-type ATPase
MILALRTTSQLAENFNGADLRNICTEAGMFAIRDERDYTVQEDFMKVGGTQCACLQAEQERNDMGWKRIVVALTMLRCSLHFITVMRAMTLPYCHHPGAHAGCAQACGGQEAGKPANLRQLLWRWQGRLVMTHFMSVPVLC